MEEELVESLYRIVKLKEKKGFINVVEFTNLLHEFINLKESILLYIDSFDPIKYKKLLHLPSIEHLKSHDKDVDYMIRQIVKNKEKSFHYFSNRKDYFYSLPIGKYIIIQKPREYNEKFTFYIKILQHIAEDFIFKEFRKTLEKESLYSGVILTTSDFIVLHVSERILDALNYSKEDVVSKHLQHIITPDFRYTLSTMKYSKGEVNIVTSLKSSENRDIKCMLNVNSFKGGFVIQVIPLSNEKIFRSTLEKTTNIDLETGIANKYSFIKSFNEIIEESKYKKFMDEMLILRITNYHVIERIYGNKKSKDLIVKIIDEISKHIRTYDLVARGGNSSIYVLLKNISKIEDMISITSKLYTKVEKFVKKMNYASVKIVIGSSIYPIDGMSPGDLISKANIAVRYALENNKKISFYKQDFDKNIIESAKVVASLKEAIKQDQFLFYYQPYFDSETLQIKGAEALVRWKKNNSIIPPLKFIPHLEKSGDIVELEKHLFYKIIQFLENSKLSVPISINLSPLTLKSGAIENMINLLKRYPTIAKNLNIEITERVFINNIDYMMNTLKKIKETNSKISIDDFGTGYSSLKYIAFLPIDTLKIDISFVRDMLLNKRLFSIVKSIILISRNMNIKTIAEGVETQEQLNSLQSLGCDYIQGYLLSKPLDEAQFLNNFNSGNSLH